MLINSFWDRLWAAAIKDRYAKLQRLDQQITLYDRGIIPQARQARGRLPGRLLRWGCWISPGSTRTRSPPYNAELALQEFLKDFEENWAELEWLVGAELPRSAGGSK